MVCPPCHILARTQGPGQPQPAGCPYLRSDDVEKQGGRREDREEACACSQQPVLCLLGQILIDKTRLTPARILVGYVITGVILGGIGLYKPFADFSGAGATVPLTGFGYLLAGGVKKAVDSQGVIGIFTGGLEAAAGGITMAVFAGLIAGFLFKTRDKS